MNDCSGFTLKKEPIPQGFVQKSYEFTIAVVGGSSPYRFEVSSEALPDGIVLDAATGELSGVPTRAGAVDAEISVTSSEGCKSSAFFHFESVACNVLDIIPAAGTAEGGEDVVLIGENFRTGVVVLIDDQKADSIEVLSGKAIKIKTPKYNKNVQLPYEAEVEVIQDNISVTAPKKYRYISTFLPIRFRSGVLVVDRGRIAALSFNMLIVFTPEIYFSPTEARVNSAGQAISWRRCWLLNRLGVSVGLQLGERGETTQNLLAGVSYKLIREADVIGGVRFGSHDPTTPFRWGESVFFGMTFDPAILLRLRAGK
jgi:hypothetical protein